VGKPEYKRTVRRSRCRWVHNIKMSLREIDWSGKGPVEGCCESDNESSASIKLWMFLSSCLTGGLSRSAELRTVSYSGLTLNFAMSLFKVNG
jgi:hypothetical protein